MAGLSLGVGGAWKEMVNLSIGVGGAWKQVKKVSVGVGGVWKDAWIHLSVSLTSLSASRTSTSPTNAVATASILNDGTWSSTAVGGGTNTGTWLTAGAASEVDVYLTGTGDTPTGSALNTWLNCGTTRAWTLTQTSLGSKSFSGTLTFRNAATLEELDTAPLTISAEESL